MPAAVPLTDDEVELILADTVFLCGIPAPTFREQARASAVHERLRALGLDPAIDDVGNVICRLGGPGPALALCAHLDTVFPDLEPVRPVREGTRLSGPGVGDNALGAAALLHVARALAAEPPAQPVLLVATVGEEGLGDLRGVTALLDTEPVHGLVAIEGHGIDSLAVGGIASARVRIDLTGPGGHSWSDRGTGSAVHELIAIGERVLACAAPAAVNVGTLEGGTAVNAIAERASMLIDLRHGDPRVVDAALARVLRATEVAPHADVTARAEVVGRRPGGRTPDGATLLEAARAARRLVDLGPAEEHLASTDANAALGRGIPAIGIGISRGDGAHTVGEWIAVPPIRRGAAALVTLIRLADQADCAGPGYTRVTTSAPEEGPSP